MMMARRFSFALSIVAVLSFPAGGPASAQQAAIDPQALIGECIGTWEYNRASGAYTLTLTRLENGIYYGTVWTSSAASNPPYDLEGKLEGDVFKYTSTNNLISAELKVDGDKMAGTGGGRVVTGVKLFCQKKK